MKINSIQQHNNFCAKFTPRMREWLENKAVEEFKKERNASFFTKSSYCSNAVQALYDADYYYPQQTLDISTHINPYTKLTEALIFIPEKVPHYIPGYQAIMSTHNDVMDLNMLSYKLRHDNSNVSYPKSAKKDVKRQYANMVKSGVFKTDDSIRSFVRAILDVLPNNVKKEEDL